MDYVRAFFHVALSVEVATVFMFVGAACSLSWPFFFIAYQAQVRSGAGNWQPTLNCSIALFC